MKQAHLHNGEVLQLPDSTPDEMVDQIVAHHHAALAQQQQDEENANSQPHIDQSSAVISREHAHDRAQREEHHNNTMMMMLGAHAQKTQSDQERNAHIANLSAQLGGISQRLQATEQIVPMLAALTQAIQALTAEVKATGGQILKGVTAEKKLNFDGRGRAVGIQARMAEDLHPSDPNDNDERTMQ